MDFQTLKRRDLQFLCKHNNIPANTTNATMADALASLPTVEGLEDFLGNLESGAQGSPERSVITSPNVTRTTARGKALKAELEGSKMATRTRCGTRTRAVEGTDTRKTPATRTTRKSATQEASIQKKTHKDLQDDFEADLEEQSVVSESIGLPGADLKESSEEVSGVTVESEGQVLSESQSKAQNEVQHVNDGQDDYGKYQEEDNLVHEEQDEEPSEILKGFQKVEFHSLSRKDLQNLCKKNKIPANMTNAAMADALESLEIVEGLQEFLKDYDSQAPRSPTMSGISLSCARRSRTTQKITKPEPQSSKMITKSCRGSRRRIVEEIEQGKNDVPETPSAPSTRGKAGSALRETESIQKNVDSALQRSELKKMENLTIAEGECEVLEVSDVSDVAEFRNDTNNSDNGLFNMENLKEIDENVVEEEVLDSSEITEMLTNTVKVDISPEADCENQVTALSDSTEDVTAFEKLENIHGEDQMCKEFVSEFASAFGKLENIHAEDQMSKEFVSESATRADQLSFGNTADSKLENNKLEEVVTITSDLAVHVSAVELQGSHIADGISGKTDPESTTQADVDSVSEGSHSEDEMSESEAITQADKLSQERNVEGESEDSYSEDEISESEAITQADKLSQERNVKSESEDSYSEDEISESESTKLSQESNAESESEDSYSEDESESESLTQADKLSQESNAESESENSYSEDKISEKFDSESTAQDDRASLEVNKESDMEKNQLQKLGTVAHDSHAEDQPSMEISLGSEREKSQLEKPDITTDSVSNKLDTQSTAQADICAPAEKEIPLDHISLRKLKKMVKEKLQRMESLTSEETEVPVAKLKVDLQEGLVESESIESHKAPSEELSVPQVIPEDKENDDGVEQKAAAFQDDQRDESSENLVTNFGVNTATLCPVDLLFDNEVISEDAVTGNINVTCPPQSTPSKLSTKIKNPLLFTPTKTPISGRKNRVLDVNKENIDNSETLKIKVAVESGKLLSDVSMGQLKRDFKVLQQQSEKKRQALQSRSGNNCLLTSP